MKKIMFVVVMVGCNGIHPEHGTIIEKQMKSSGPSYGAPLIFEITIDSMGYHRSFEASEDYYMRCQIGDNH